ncbi:aquaporin [Hallella multisaccharivorax DSM 17128]|uniref:MIP family channel protein n=1 Tax=Hallella multisaccharivorax DSM 17128 TaxID=688246 RepID=F8NA30_9BACT|nr:MIP family channel protein [Hallella multisaccharivorax]EGN55760.1 MIP family channel protein [Hallella multisaccharivorax DSM 17128]GJG29261.1 aquaporin [Hallella multisaccharivorax DSM 17128]
MKKYLAEMVGTMVLVLMGCGAAVSLGCDPVHNQAAVVGTALAFGLSVVAMAYTIGSISGCHINPAITLGVYLSGRMSGKDAGMYMLFQTIGGIIGAAILYAITTSAGIIGTGANDLQVINDSGVTVTVLGGFLAELFFTCVFVLVVLGATAKTNGATNNFAGLAIGLSLVFVHLACIRYTGTSVNPARSIGPALFQGGSALTNLWIFIVAPLAGGALAAGVWKIVEPATDKK